MDQVIDFLTRDVPLWGLIVAFIAGIFIKLLFDIADVFID